MDEFDDYVEHHSTVRSGAAGRATNGEVEPNGGWMPPGDTPPEAATRPPDADEAELPDPDGSHHRL